MTGIYADYNATTPLSERAQRAMTLAFTRWGNPSSSHAVGRQANEIIEQSRESVARSLGVSPTQVVFTSGGSEAGGSVLLGSYLQDPVNFRLLISSVEHSSIRDAAIHLEKLGVPVRAVPVTSQGALNEQALLHEIQNFRPTLVSVMTANNETGVVFPISRIAELCFAAGIRLHTDAVQAYGKLSPETWRGADFVSISAHKIGGPKGAGALIVKKGAELSATHFGGAQEIKRRGGTENVLGIVGFGAAASEIGEFDWNRIQKLRDAFEIELLAIGGTEILGRTQNRLANTTSLHVQGIESEVLLGALDLEGIAISAGSACSSGSISPSHVLMAMGLPKDSARECLRISWGHQSTESEFQTVAQRLRHHIERIRARRRTA